MREHGRDAIEHLPVTVFPWEVHRGARGLVVVVERTTGLARAAEIVEPGGPLLPVVMKAMVEPSPPCVPARPPKLVCAETLLPSILGAELWERGTPVEHVPQVPLAERFATALAARLGPHTLPASAAERLSPGGPMGGRRDPRNFVYMKKLLID